MKKEELIKVSKNSPKYSLDFYCHLNKRYNDETNIDEFGCAVLSINGLDYGVEYNYCKQEGEDCSAIYAFEGMDTKFDTFKHYEIDFSKKDWKRNLYVAMKHCIKEFFYTD